MVMVRDWNAIGFWACLMIAGVIVAGMVCVGLMGYAGAM